MLRDEGDLILPANPYDLKGVGLRFTRNDRGRLRRQLGRRRVPHADRHSRSRSPTTTRRRADVRLPFPSTPAAERTRVRQFRRQHHVSRGRQREHRPQRRPTAERPAARRAVSRRPRSRAPAAACSSMPRRISTSSRGATSADSSRRDTTTAQVALLPDGTIEMKFAVGDHADRGRRRTVAGPARRSSGRSISARKERRQAGPGQSASAFPRRCSSIPSP